VSPARPSVAGALDPPIPQAAAFSSSPDNHGLALTISHARSLRALPLHQLHTSCWLDDPWPIRLDAQELGTLLETLRSSSEAASARLADNAMAHVAALKDEAMGAGRADRRLQDPRDVVAALHRILTRSRFLKGSRSCFPLETALAQMLPFVEAKRPITILTIGFPFKQHDNGLKAAGPWPDLAELGALLRLRELDSAFTALYPPGVRVVVLNDGGYSRPRGWTEMRRYRRQLKYYAQLVGLGNSVRFCDQSCFVARILGPRGWGTREKYRRTYRELISFVAGSPCPLHGAAEVDQRLAETLPRALLVVVPSFREILSSMVYSVPVPGRAGTDARQWTCQVLAQLDGFCTADISPELASARQEVVACAWHDTVDHLAAALADAAVGVAEHFPLHIRLATVASRPGCSGFSYLGGSNLLPWHGTGCLDGRGLLCAEFLVSLDHRGFLPVYCDLIGDEQPLLMVPFARTRDAHGRRQVDPELLAGARLRSR
jgi:Pyoverdine/dityrosine biosynthesis protein